MKSISLIIFVLFLRISVYGQNTDAGINEFDDISRNTLFLELLGNGGVYSLNYDRIIAPNIAVRAGFSFIPLSVNNYQEILSFPVGASYLFNFPNTPSHIEAGLGLTYLHTATSVQRFQTPSSTSPLLLQHWLTVIPMLGYRLQPKHGGFNFRILWTPIAANYLMSLNTFSDFSTRWNWVGVSVGYTF